MKKIIVLFLFYLTFLTVSACTFLMGPEDFGIEVDYKTDRALYKKWDDVVIALLENNGTRPIFYERHRHIQQWDDGEWGEEITMAGIME